MLARALLPTAEDIFEEEGGKMMAATRFFSLLDPCEGEAPADKCGEFGALFPKKMDSRPIALGIRSTHPSATPGWDSWGSKNQFCANRSEGQTIWKGEFTRLMEEEEGWQVGIIRSFPAPPISITLCIIGENANVMDVRWGEKGGVDS